MSLSSTTCRVRYTGNGATSVYSYPFRIIESADLLVTLRLISTGVETPLVLNTDYTVAGVGLAAGGTITLTAGSLASTYDIVIRRVMALVQPTSIRNEGAFYASTHENVFDYLTMITQQLMDWISRSAYLPETFSPADFNPILPEGIVGAPSSVLCTDPTGTFWVAGPSLSTIGSAVTSSAAAAASAAAALVSQTAAASSASAASASATAAAASAASAAAMAMRANVVALPSAASSVNVVYSSALPSADVPVISILNTSDANPIFLQAIITAFSTTGFTAKFNAPTDTANYSLSYQTSGVV